MLVQALVHALVSSPAEVFRCGVCFPGSGWWCGAGCPTLEEAAGAAYIASWEVLCRMREAQLLSPGRVIIAVVVVKVYFYPPAGAAKR